MLWGVGRHDRPQGHGRSAISEWDGGDLGHQDLSVWFNFRTTVHPAADRYANAWGLGWIVEHRCTECGELISADDLIDHVRRHVN
jgi:hypothetical protein